MATRKAVKATRRRSPMSTNRTAGRRASVEVANAVSNENASHTASREHIARIDPARTREIPLQATRGGTAQRTVKADEVKDQVVEIELEGGIRLLTQFDQFLADYPGAVSRGESSDEIILPSTIPLDVRTRGVGSLALKALRILGFDPVSDAGSATGLAICEWAQGKLLWKETGKEGEPATQRLWRCAPDGAFALVPIDGEIRADKPILVFLHGTASSSKGSFSELWDARLTDVRQQLFKPYGKDIYAFEHFSLTQSPIENAIALVDSLPAGACLHLISHSRGGLVGEILCRAQAVGRAPFTEEEITRYGLVEDEDAAPAVAAAHRRQRDLLRVLNKLLLDKRLQVQRFARVACPARGTTLASERLDRWLSVALNLLGAIPSLAGDYLDIFEEFARAIIKSRTQPQTLPGLEAMMPTSPLIKLLNQPGVTVSADLHVIAGDVQASGIGKRMLVYLADKFYDDEDHDFVVDTRSMYGGAARAAGAKVFSTRGAEVYHFTYFANQKTAAKLIDALQVEPEKDGFDPLQPEQAEITVPIYRSPVRAAGEAPSVKPIVFVIPGIMGSNLAITVEDKVNGKGVKRAKRIWVDLGQLALGGLAKLPIDADNVTPDGLIASAYGELIAYLGAGWDVVPFPYDWRLSLKDEAKRLAAQLGTWLDEAERRRQPLVILAHSMGGLLARVMIALNPQIWERVCCHPGGRLIMLGTPNGGSYVIPRMLMGRETMVQGVSLVDVCNTQRQLIDIIKEFPGALEMLPNDAEKKFFQAASWQAIKAKLPGDWPIPSEARLNAARMVRELLDAPTPNPERIRYVCGMARQTPSSLVLDAPPQTPIEKMGSQIPEPFYFEATEKGDGRVLWDSGRLPYVAKTWWMDAAHGDMAASPNYFPALLELLQNGETNLLMDAEPAIAARGMAETQIARAPRLAMRPDQQMLEAALLGGAGGRRRKKAVRKVSISMAHGNLAFASFPVVVGHYEGDTIVSAERSLDQRLNGRLSQRNELGLYPGLLNTTAVFFDARDEVPGAIVVGLGPAGMLAPGDLSDTLTHALLSYALALTEQAACGGGTGAEDAGGTMAVAANVSALLIGTGAGGLSIRDSLVAMLRAVRDANLSLGQAKTTRPVAIEQMQVVELYQDRAISAAGHLLELITRDPDFREYFDFTPSLATLEGGRTRVTFEEPPGWWERLLIERKKDGALAFTMLTDRARADVSLLPTQRALVDKFVASAVTSVESDKDVAATLFELLLPNRLKEHAPEQRKIVLIVDDDTAGYPWELMVDRFGREDQDRKRGNENTFAEPPAVRGGIVRQRLTRNMREKVRATVQDVALVVGNPPADRRQFPDLPAARSEAVAVAAQLRSSGYTVVEAIEKPATEIITKLFGQGYRILHLAGHGVFEFELPQETTSPAAPTNPPPEDASASEADSRPVTVSGMVIGENIFLTPGEVEQMRVVPELVFINCCHLGEGRDELTYLANRNRLAANIAMQLIRMGVRAVVAAGWAVADAAAEMFARTFYEEMLKGVPFGDAVTQARKVIYYQYPDVNTWGAYQCYGDPSFQLTARESQGERRRRSFFTPAEAICDISNIAQGAMTAGDDEIADLGERLQAVIERVPDTWLGEEASGSGAMHQAIARAQSELDQFDAAIKSYLGAVAAAEGDYDARTLEQLANLQARWALQQAVGDPRAYPRALASIRSAKRQLADLMRLGKTVERYSLLGSACKREAMLLASKAKMDAAQRRATLKAVAEVEENYRKAHELQMRRTGKPKPYPLVNWLSARAVLANGKPDAKLARDIDTWLPQIEQADCGTDFWSTVMRADSELLRHVATEDAGRTIDDLAAAYRRAKRRGVSQRQWRSVLEHLSFVAQVSAALAAPAARGRAAELAKLVEEVRALQAK